MEAVTMAEGNNSKSSDDFPSTWEIYKDAWRNDRRWRWEMILFAIVTIAFFVFLLLQSGVFAEF